MSTHHKQTALRYLDNMGMETDLHASALVHAQLETAAQIERLADAADRIAEEVKTAGGSLGDFLGQAFPAILAMIGSGGLSFGVKRPFDPSGN